MPSRQPRWPSIGLVSCSARVRCAHLGDGLAGEPRHLVEFGLGLRQEFVQRRVEQPDRHRQAGHDLEDLGEIGALHRQQLGERGAAAALLVGHDHLADRADAVGLEEHVLGARQADALGAEIARGAGVGRRSRRWRGP